MEQNERIDSAAGEPVSACKRRKHLRLAALAVSCALLGGIAGGAATGLLLQGRERAAMRPAGRQTAVSGAESTGAEPSAARVASTAGELTPTQLYEHYAPCVVGVLNLSAVTDLYGKDTMQASTGSGVLLTGDGEILTNYHVVKDCTQLTVTLYDGTEHTAKLLGYEEDSDIALLKIDGSGYRHARLGDSDRLRIGTEVAAIGNPLGDLDYSLNVGYISAKDRDVDLDGPSIRMMQLDAAINPGNSGGALFDSYGNVIGIVYAKSSSVSIEGIGYAIPVNNIKDLVAQMINDPDSVKDQTKGSQIMLGITIRDITEEMSKQYSMPVGVYITEVSSMSAAERAGLQKGDIITEFAGETVTSADDLNAIKAKQTSGDTVSVKIDRNGKAMTLDLVVPQPTDVDTSSSK